MRMTLQVTLIQCYFQAAKSFQHHPLKMAQQSGKQIARPSLEQIAKLKAMRRQMQLLKHKVKKIYHAKSTLDIAKW